MTFDQAYSTLMRIGDQLGIRADNHEELIESELRRYTGDESELESWVRALLGRRFPSVAGRPAWLQEEEWPVSSSGHPLTFLGQINVPHDATDLFHDDTTFYLFFDAGSGGTEVVVQQS
jgi:hypothetical protein